ncbi:MAG: HPr family phosphocarrier protein [Thermoguttaceae bacterium]|nr:HPr family phosphocarrier protein [Thermoguttaceae bacterium]MDW8078642.1 HPr family phosphocarrier protein [Thermoguttaceae bacterium]
MAEASVVRKVRVRAPDGLHMRSAAAIATLVRQRNAEVILHKGEQSANGANVLEILTLAVMEGEELTVEAKGPEAELAADAVVRFIENECEPVPPICLGENSG